jgi:serine protease Do
MKISGLTRATTAFGIGLVLSAIVIWWAAAPVLRAQTMTGRVRVPQDSRVQVFGGTEIGVGLQEVDATDVTRLKLPSASGALVSSVRSDGPAAQAGFKVNDVVVSFDGQTVRSAKQLTRMIYETPDGREVEATVLRDGAKVNLKVAPAAADVMSRLFSSNGSMQPFQFSNPNGNGFIFAQPFLNDRFAERFGTSGSGNDFFGNSPRRLGVEVQELTGQLGDYFGTKEGVLVTTVDENTPAKTAGLKPGDVITKVNNRPVTSADELRRRITGAEGDVTITFYRDRKEMAMTVKLSGGETPRTIIK